MRVLVVVAGPDSQDTVEIDLEEGASVARAISVARVAERHPGIALDRLGVWGKCRAPGSILREGDRVEVYRPLQADPKATRRARAGLRISTRSRSEP